MAPSTATLCVLTALALLLFCGHAARPSARAGGRPKPIAASSSSSSGLPRWATAHLQQVTSRRTPYDPYSIIDADAANSTDPEPSLEFYVQVDTGTSDVAIVVSPLDSDTTNGLGQVEVFALNVTSGYAASSQQLGVMRGYTIQASATSTSLAVEVEVLDYDDGAGTEGTISLQGLIRASANEIAIVGGSGSFRGIHGYDIITYINASAATVFVYHHSLYFLS